MRKQNNIPKEHRLLEEKVAEVIQVTRGSTCIFRGENTTEHEILSCALYREQAKIRKEDTKKNLQEEIIRKPNFPAIEQKIVQGIEQLLFTVASDIKILSTLQHCKAATTLIAFTYNIHLALFFACRGEQKKDGRIICLNTKGIRKEEKELYSEEYKKNTKEDVQDIVIVQPSQCSVFLHCPHGFLETDTHESVTIVTIDAKEKQSILNALKNQYSITEETVFRDIQDFLTNSDSYKTSQMYFDIGLSYQSAKEYAEAIEHYTSAIALRPNYVQAYTNRANAKEELGTYERAIDDYSLAITVQPDYAEAYLHRGRAKAVLGKYDEAIRDFDTAITVQPDYAEAYLHRGSAKAVLGKYHEAIRDFDAVITLKPNYAEAYYNRGLMKSNIGTYDEAIADYNAAIQLQPENADAYFHRGNAKEALRMYEQAIDDYSLAIQLQQANVASYNNRGNAKALLEKHEEAIADYDTAIQLQPENATAYYNKGNAKVALEQYEDAIVNYDIAIKLNTENAQAYYNRGNVKEALEKHEEAIADYDIAIQLQPDYEAAYYNRSIAKEALGDMRVKDKEYTEAERYYKEAMIDCEEAEKKDPSLSSRAQPALQRLKETLEKFQKAKGTNQ